MTEQTHADELNRATDRLAGVTNELSQVLERLVELEQARNCPEETVERQPRPRVPLFSKGSGNPTLAERFEEELHGTEFDH